MRALWESTFVLYPFYCYQIMTQTFQVTTYASVCLTPLHHELMLVTFCSFVRLE